jgi:pSer/pThr/pTyr-binding forkhead associated (FHA) protein
MEPHLIAISGPFKGTSFALSEAETLIGRERANPIVLNEPSVSRCHCLIKRSSAPEQPDRSSAEGGLDTDCPQFTIIDRDSYNGTFVNGVPVKEQLLKDGDQIAVGDVLLLFLLREGETTTGVPIELDEVDLITRSTIRLPVRCAYRTRKRAD